MPGDYDRGYYSAAAAAAVERLGAHPYMATGRQRHHILPAEVAELPPAGQRVKDPRRKRRGFARRFKQMQLSVPSLFDAMLLEVSADHLRRDFVTDGASQIALLPEGSAPEASLDLRECADDRSGTPTLEPGHHLRDGIPGRDGTTEIAMIWTPFHLRKGNSILLGNIGKEFLYPPLPLALQHVTSVRGRPDQVIERLVDGMGCSAEDYAAIVRPQTVYASGH